ncbi:MAG: exodeoxyribonuclease VII small subunit [Alistipes sp.]|nr:exodeoxyribonuclease VII small subunit [Candidatus Minthomonas equi]
MERYEKKVAELEKLVKTLEDTSRPLGGIDADVKKAVSLISECRSLLREQESRMNDLINDVRDETIAQENREKKDAAGRSF